MDITLIDFIEAPVCETCCDYVDYPNNKLIQIKDGSIEDGRWVHYGNHEERCPGQDDDDTEDVAEPLLSRDGKWFIVAFNCDGSTVFGTRRVVPAEVQPALVGSDNGQ